MRLAGRQAFLALPAYPSLPASRVRAKATSQSQSRLAQRAEPLPSLPHAPRRGCARAAARSPAPGSHARASSPRLTGLLPVPVAVQQQQQTRLVQAFAIPSLASSQLDLKFFFVTGK